MLESLIKGNGSIHELNVEGAFLEQKPYQPRALYEALKATPLYDAERGQWNSSMNEGQELRSTSRTAFAQLLGVLVEAQFNQQVARAGYDVLKRTSLYDSEQGQWNGYMSEGQKLESANRFAPPQFLGVLVEALFNQQTARTGYDALKRTSLFDAELGQWNGSMNEGQVLQRFGCDAFVLLPCVLMEAQFNPETAREQYHALKQTPLYDAERGQWNSYMTKGQRLQNTDRHADIQLLGVLLEAQFNPEAAREQYEALIQTPLYDSGRRQWNYYITEWQELEDSHRFASTQLLAVLVEAKLLTTLPDPITRPIPPLPVIEEF